MICHDGSSVTVPAMRRKFRQGANDKSPQAPWQHRSKPEGHSSNLCSALKKFATGSVGVCEDLQKLLVIPFKFGTWGIRSEQVT
jgi:hypothetical protein